MYKLISETYDKVCCGQVAEITRKRSAHLRDGCDENLSAVEEKLWRKVRLDRMLVEHLLREVGTLIS